MHSLFYFNSTLTDNDITIFALVPPSVHTQPDCRCPPSHPVAQETTCENLSGTSHVPRVDSNSHHPSLANDGNFTTWWQSETGEAPVNLTIGLGGLRAALTVGIRFRSIQPQSMVLYYSNDGGVTYTPRQYYSSDCLDFGMHNNGLLRTATDVNCVTSESAPLSNQVVDFRVLDVGNRPEANDYFHSTDLQNFALATHIRLELINWNTLRSSDQYFAVDEVIVGGQECVCNGHANTCRGSNCICQHNTAGMHCEMCLPLFNNEPWAPGTISSANQCEACECNNHADLCEYDAPSTTGVCVGCRDNTQGVQCELCQPFFYNPQEIPQNLPDSCLTCDCYLPGVRDNGICLDNSGQCNCKTFTTGRRCDQCLSGYYNLTDSNVDGCTSCNCDSRGTVDGGIECNQISGQCFCKANVIGQDCSSCVSNHYGLENAEGCLSCDQQCDNCTGAGPRNCVVSFYRIISSMGPAVLLCVSYNNLLLHELESFLF